MIIATLLLSAFPQEPATPEILPKVGSETAVRAQEEFRTWLGAAAENQTFPLHAEYAVKASFGLFNSVDNMEATFGGTMTSDVPSQNKVRHHLIGLASLAGENEFPLEITLVLDSESFWVALKADGLSLVPENGLYFTGRLAAVQDLYRFVIDYQKWAVEQAKLNGESPSLGLGEHFTALMQSLPEKGTSLLHPTSTLFYAMAPFSCQKLERRRGSVYVSMALDTQPEAFMVELAAQWDDFWSDFLWNSEKDDRTSKALQILGDHLSLTLRFDESTAVPQTLNIDFDVHAETLNLGTAEERMTFAASVSLQTQHANALDASLFVAPHLDQVPTDVTVLLELALIEMQNEKAEEESKLDGSF